MYCRHNPILYKWSHYHHHSCRPTTSFAGNAADIFELVFTGYASAVVPVLVVPMDAQGVLRICLRWPRSHVARVYTLLKVIPPSFVLPPPLLSLSLSRARARSLSCVCACIGVPFLYNTALRTAFAPPACACTGAILRFGGLFVLFCALPITCSTAWSFCNRPLCCAAAVSPAAVFMVLTTFSQWWTVYLHNHSGHVLPRLVPLPCPPRAVPCPLPARVCTCVAK